MDGTGATARDGRVGFRHTDGTGLLRMLTSSSNMHWYEVSSGRLGAFNDGDLASLSATYTVSPDQAITSP